MSKYDKMFAVGETFWVMRLDSSIEDVVIDQHTVASIVKEKWPTDSKLYTADGKAFNIPRCHATRIEAEAERAVWIIEQQAIILGRSTQLKRFLDKLTARGEWPFALPETADLPHTLHATVPAEHPRVEVPPNG